MSGGIPFAKIEGCGNDYVFVDVGLGKDAVEESRLGDLAGAARRISHRHTGVGSDGLILLDRGGGEVRMRMWNADGSRGRLCLNGLRGAALLAFTLRPDLGERFTVETDAGPREVSVAGGPTEASVTVQAGLPDFRREAIPATGTTAELWDEEFPGAAGPLKGHGLSVGNPHLVLLLGSAVEVEAAPLAEVGRAIQEGDRFPEGINVHLAAATPDGGLIMRPWERGSGATLACGTGAVAVFAVARRLGLVGENARVRMPGGTVELREKTDGLELAGPARIPFRGQWTP